MWVYSRRQGIGLVVYGRPVSKRHFSYISEVGAIYLVLGWQPCPSVPEQPTKGTRKEAGTWELEYWWESVPTSVLSMG